MDVEPPDFETRLAIVKSKTALMGLVLPDNISAYIAAHVTANVRQLEGTINKIKAYKDLLGSDTDEETVTRAIQDMLPVNAAISKLEVGSVQTTFFLFLLLFTVLLIAEVGILLKAIKKGPEA